jgi:hypothetical protein
VGASYGWHAIVFSTNIFIITSKVLLAYVYICLCNSVYDIADAGALYSDYWLDDKINKTMA